MEDCVCKLSTGAELKRPAATACPAAVASPERVVSVDHGLIVPHCVEYLDHLLCPGLVAGSIVF